MGAQQNHWAAWLHRRGHHEVVVRRGVDRVGAEVHLVRVAAPFGQSLLARLRTAAGGPCPSRMLGGIAGPEWPPEWPHLPYAAPLAFGRVATLFR